MTGSEKLPELKQIIGAMLFAAKGPVTAKQIRRVFMQVAELRGGMFADFADVKEKQITQILGEIDKDLEKMALGFRVHEVANGLRYQNDISCGPWVRELLEKGKPNKLSRPALETLAIVAYRQPCVKSEIEGVRGVSVDAILKKLLEMQLVRIVGRSELPGRPLLFGTTHKFLEHFGLKGLKELPGISELRKVQEQQEAMDKAAEEEKSEAELFDADEVAADEELPQESTPEQEPEAKS